MMSPSILGVAFGLTSALSWSLANATIKGVSQRFGSFGALVSTQVLGGLLALSLAIFVEGAPGELGMGGFWVLLGGAVAACLAYGGLFAAFKDGDLSLIAPVISTWSIVSTGIGIFVMGERPGTIALLGLCLIVGGNVLLLRKGSKKGGAISGKSLLAAIISAIGFGTLVPALGVVGESLGRLWAVPAIWGLELAIGIPVLLKLGYLQSAPSTVAEWRSAALPGFFEVGGFLAMSFGLAVAPVAIVAPASSIGTGLTVAWGILFFGERLTPAMAFGAVAASIGVILVATG